MTQTNNDGTTIPLDADAQAFADQFAQIFPHGFAGLGVEGARQFIEQANAQTPPAASVRTVSEHQAPGPHGDIRLRLYRPESEKPLPVLMYLHGGGWTTGSIDGGVDYLVRDIVNATGIAVVSVDYRLAPGHKFPIPVEDCHAALAWLQNMAGSLGLDASRIAIGGDSAGANVSAAITHLERDSAAAPLIGQLLLFPATEYAVERPSWIDNTQAPLLTTNDTLWFWDQYLRTEADRKDPRATPANANSFAELPPALVVVAGHDPLRDDGLNYARLLTEGGTRTEVVRFDGGFHDFVLFPTLDAYPQALASITEFLKETIAAN
ncbi:lipase/esterase [Rhodococcus opacus M213]|uniref:Lipase/esterase n=1 Tax=Rhodococcus opacus M213 TaxID=1129896 RepID=K8XRJ2_RHOOP|nr:alpha/beta hydrolase [Rhodococcus opacus]EKT80807.1 lipase/esterase [Rhodococcus opacus M213]